MDENKDLSEKFKAKEEELRGYRNSIKEKFEMERKLTEIDYKYQNLLTKYNEVEENAKRA